MAKRTAISLARNFKISAEMQSGPVTLDTFNEDKIFCILLDRKATKSSNSISGIPKKGQSISSGGNSAFLLKFSANKLAFRYGSFIQTPSCFSGGIEDIFFFPKVDY